MHLRMRGYRVRVSGQVLFPLLVLAFSVSYAMQVRGLRADTLLFAKPVLYICVVLSLYLLAKEGVRVERAWDQGQHDGAAERLSMVGGVIPESRRMLILTTNIFLYWLCFEYVGFLPISILFLVVTMLLCGVRRRLVLVAVPLSVVGSLYVVLGWWLKFPLPDGVLLKLFTK